jgi:hypothetical protein
MNLNIYDVLAAVVEEKVMADLVKNALYAVRSDNSELVYECLGQARMARALGAISYETYRKIEHVLINGYLNAGDGQRKEYARTITAEDIRQGRSWRDK